MAFPALQAIRRHFADADLTIAAPASVAAVFREETVAAPDHVIELPPGTQGATAALEAGRFDLGILLPNSFRSAWQFYKAGIPARWGFATAGRRLLLTERSPRARARGRHQSDYYRDLVRGLGIPCDDQAAPPMRPSGPSARRADALLAERHVSGPSRLVALAPGAAYGQAKQWPPDRMAQLAARLVREADVTCLVLGATHDRAAARAIESWLRTHAPDTVDRVVDFVGRTSIGALVGVVDRAAVVVSNDSGGMHLAAALGRPVVAIFGPTDERVTRPIGDHDVITEPVFCRPCLLRDCPIDHRCMKRISVDTVFAAVTRRLAAAAEAP